MARCVEGWDKANEISGDFVRNAAPESPGPRTSQGTLDVVHRRTDGPWVRMRRGYTSSYTSWRNPTHPLDPRKIFSLSFWLSILSAKQTVRYSFDVRGFNLGDYGVLVSRSLFASSSLSLPFSRACSSRSESHYSLSDLYPMVYHIRRSP